MPDRGMSFFGPISPPLLNESSTPIIRRAFRRARIVGNFAFVQAFVQILGFLSGILLVRTLSPREYAYFTIANTMQGTLNLLADIGISVGLISIGGRIWQDRHRFGELISAALGVRRKLALAAILVVTPILYAMLVKNGASNPYAVILIALVLAGLLIQLSLGVLSVVPRLHSDIGRIQLIDFTGGILRLFFLVALLYVFLNAAVAIAVAAVAFFVQYLMLHRYVAGMIDLRAPANSEDRRAILGFVRSLAPNAAFYCFQGQITVFLISFFAHHANAVAEVGALGRLAMIFTVLSNLLTNVFVPAFARCQQPRRLVWLYAGILGCVAAFSVVVLAGAAVFPNQFLYVLGNKYAHLHRELVLMVGGAVVSALTGAFWALNASKAWVAGAWLYIPLTLATQMALIPYTDFSSVRGVLVFNLLSGLPNLFLNMILSYRGFAAFQRAHS